jgi:hypothetical protein
MCSENLDDLLSVEPVVAMDNGLINGLLNGRIKELVKSENMARGCNVWSTAVRDTGSPV